MFTADEDLTEKLKYVLFKPIKLFINSLQP